MTRVWASADFEQRIDERVLALLCQPALTFHALLNALPSVYPTVLLQSISRLSESGLIDPKAGGALQAQASVRDDTMRVTRTMLPLPHPVEYEWRFCPEPSALWRWLPKSFTGHPAVSPIQLASRWLTEERTGILTLCQSKSTMKRSG